MNESGAAVQLVINGEPLLNSNAGVGVYTLRLIRGLLRQAPSLNFRVLLDDSLRGKFPDIPEDICVFLGSRLAWPHPLLAQVARANRAVAMARRCFPDAIFHSPGPFWSWRRPAKTVVTLHDCIYRHFPRYLGRSGVRKWLAYRTERFAAESDLVLTVSEFSARDLAETAGIPPQKIRLLHNWVGPEYEAASMNRAQVEAVRGKFHLPERFWLYVGGYDYRKNVERLIDGYAAASETGGCPPLVLVGAIPTQTAPPFSNVRGGLLKSGLREDQVRLLGPIGEENLPGMYAAAELLIYPSLYEGFGLPPLEAMAVGTPVLVSDCTSLPELVIRSECRFDPLSTAAIAEKLCAAAKHPEQFSCAFDDRFSESFAIRRFINLLGLG